MREIAALKSAVSGDVSKHRRHRASSIASSSFTSATPDRKVPAESIKSPTKWNEKMAERSFDDKFSTIIDDGMKSGGERSDKRLSLMRRQEIDNASRRPYSASTDVNESLDVASDLMPQDESFN